MKTTSVFALLFILSFNLSCSSTTSTPAPLDNSAAPILDPAPMPACGFKELDFKTIKRKNYSLQQASTGTFLVEVGDTPITITEINSKQTCDTKFGLVGSRDVWELTGTNNFLYRYSSNNVQKMALVDGKTCKPIWESNLHRNSTVGEARIWMQSVCKDPKCEEKGTRKNCDCPPNQVWVLDAKCNMKQSE